MGSLTGAVALTRQSLRRDRLLISFWLVALLGTCYASAAATGTLYPTAAERASAAAALDASPGVVALYGPIVDPHSLGELSMIKMTVLYAVFVAMLFGLLVRRHTRLEEESGRAELLGGTALGRDAVLASVGVESVLLAAVLGATAAAACVAGGLPLTGSMAFGASWAGIGLVAGAVMAVACQLSVSSRSCAALATAALGGSFLVRAVGDVTTTWISWLSTFGWSTQLHAWSGPRWWVLVLYASGNLLGLSLAQILRRRRDLGAGMLAPRPGPEVASARLANATALAIRLHTPMLLGWSAAMLVLGAVLGAIAPSVGTMLDTPAARDMIERLGGQGEMQDTLIAAELSMMAVVVTCFAVAVIAHSGRDEREGRTEQVLVTATSRRSVLMATASVAVLGSTWLLLLGGSATGLGYGLAGGEAGRAVLRVVPAALAQAPAVWVVTGLALLAFAWRSGWSVAGWGLVAGFLTLGQLGELLRLPNRVIELSPYVHAPRMPAEPLTYGPMVILSGISLTLVAVAAMRYRSRDIG